jgi:MFS family permease
MNSDNATQKLGPIWLAPGISRLNALTFLYVGLIGICMMAYINFAQPYLFSVNLDIPENQRGRLTGQLAFWSETVLILLAGIIGALSDRIGRRIVTTAGFLIIGVGYAIYPFAESVAQLYLYRTVFAVGSAIILTMLFTIMADYPQNRSRGKLAAAIAMMSGFGIMFIVLFLGNLPVWFVEGGKSELVAGRYTFLTATGICIFSAGVVAYGLKGGRPTESRAHYALLEFMKIGFGAARNPKIALAFGASFAARADMIVLGAYFSLWLEQVGTSMGMSPGQAIAQAASIYAIVQGSALVWAPFLGYITDRLSRINAVIFGVTLATFGFLAIGLITDPLSMVMYPAAVLLGIGQSSAIVTCEALIGEEAPAEERGAIMGIFSLCGGVGVLLITLGSGFLYDQWTPAGPFVLMGACNLLILAWAVVVRARAVPMIRPQE